MSQHFTLVHAGGYVYLYPPLLDSCALGGFYTPPPPPPPSPPLPLTRRFGARVFHRFFGGVCRTCVGVADTPTVMLQHLEVYHTRHTAVPNTLLEKAAQLIASTVGDARAEVDDVALKSERATHPPDTTTLDVRCEVPGALDRALLRARVRRVEAAALRATGALSRVFRSATITKVPYHPDVPLSGPVLAAEKYLDHERADVLMAASRRAAVDAIEERRQWLLKPLPPAVHLCIEADIARRLDVVQDFVTRVTRGLRDNAVAWARPVVLSTPVTAPVDEARNLLPVEVAIAAMIESERDIAQSASM